MIKYIHRDKSKERDYMINRALKIAGFTVIGILAIFYIAFLISPLFVNSYIKSHNSEITDQIESLSGFKVVLNDLKLVTTPKLTAGIKLSHAELAPSQGQNITSLDNFEVKLSLIPLLIKKVEIDKVSAENIRIFLEVKKDGHFLLEDYLKDMPISAQEQEESASVPGLPFGFKLSNKLPNIYLKKFNIEFISTDTNKKYYFDAPEFKLTDFIFNKKVKITSNGSLYLDGSKHFSYDVKIKNYIMPLQDINDVVFAPQPEQTESKSTVTAKTAQTTPVINIIDIFDGIHKNKLAANLTADIKTEGTFEDINLFGKTSIDGLTVATDGQTLPESSFNMEFKSKSITINSTFYTSKSLQEITSLNGNIKTGKNPEIDLRLASNAGINNIINLIDSIAKSFGINDLNTLSGTGNIDADLWLTGDKKKIKSSGYLKIPEASISYGLYSILIDKIKADIDLSNNNLNFKDVSFSVFNQPLKFYGTISDKAEADLHLTADKLLIKALVAAAGQFSLLKENKFNSGTLSAEAILEGKLNSPIPSVSLSADNVNIKNTASDTTLKLNKAVFDITTNDGTYEGLLNINSADIISPLATVKIPQSEVTLNEKDLNINNAYMIIDNSRIDITGSINDYADPEDVSININARGNLVASDLYKMIPAEFRKDMSAKGKLPLKVSVTGNLKQQLINASLNMTPDNYLSILDIDLMKNKPAALNAVLKFANDTLKIDKIGLAVNGNDIAFATGSISNISKTQNMAIDFSIPSYISMPIPMMGQNSLIKTKGDLIIGGTPLNPTLKGSVSIPLIELTDMLVKLENLDMNLSGSVANGKGTLGKLTSGGIVAENLAADFTYNLNNGIIYLSNITGSTFKGNIKGNVSYNIMNGKIGVDLTGEELDAASAINGAAGIKNALTGTLGFTANVTTSGATDVELIKNLKGQVSFDIKEGAFAGIGRIEMLLSANNIMSNIILKAVVAALSSVDVIKQSANFDYIKGNMTFSDGWANISSITSAGENTAYYITGKYNILNGTANLIILGRLSSDVVAVLGPLGELSVDKFTSYIPKFGSLTSSIIKTMTTNPATEKTENIPSLTGGDTVYKDFKVEFNGGIESTSAVKSFKWLNNPDMSAIESTSLKEQVQTSTENLKQNIKTNIENVKEIQTQTKESLKNTASDIKQQSQQAKEDIKNQVQNVKDSVDEIMNLFKKPSSQTRPTTETTPSSTTAQ